MSTQFTEIYRRDLTTNIKVSKRADEQTRLRKIERWPKEAGLSLPLDETGINFLQLVRNTANEYGLTTGERNWSTKHEENKCIVSMEWKLNRGNEVKGYAKMNCVINLTPIGEEGDNLVYQAQLHYTIEISNDVIAEKASEGVPEFRL